MMSLENLAYRSMVRWLRPTRYEVYRSKTRLHIIFTHTIPMGSFIFHHTWQKPFFLKLNFHLFKPEGSKHSFTHFSQFSFKTFTPLFTFHFKKSKNRYPPRTRKPFIHTTFYKLKRLTFKHFHTSMHTALKCLKHI